MGSRPPPSGRWATKRSRSSKACVSSMESARTMSRASPATRSIRLLMGAAAPILLPGAGPAPAIRPVYAPISPGSRPRAGARGARWGSPRRGSPAASSADDLGRRGAAAAGDDRAGVAHPLALGRRAAGDERDPRHVREVLGGPGRRLLLGRRRRSRRSARAPRSSGSAANSSRTSRNCVPMIGSPPMPDARRLADPGVGHRLDRLVGQRARARDDADAALAVDRARDDPDLGLAGRRGARAVRADQAWRPRAGPPRRPGSCRAPGCPR